MGGGFLELCKILLVKLLLIHLKRFQFKIVQLDIKASNLTSFNY